VRARSQLTAAANRRRHPRPPHRRRPARRYHDLYLQVKGARYKTKRVLMEQIHLRKATASRDKAIADQATLAKTKAETKKTRKTEAKKAQVA